MYMVYCCIQIRIYLCNNGLNRILVLFIAIVTGPLTVTEKPLQRTKTHLGQVCVIKRIF